MGLFHKLAMMATSAVIIPYTTAFICNLLCMWPFTLRNLIRALTPHQVYLINCAILRELMKVKYIPLLIRWRYFYQFADETRIIKDIPFGRNSRHLDIYHPTKRSSTVNAKPVVIYIFGGAYSSGDKSMYGLLCSNLADRLDAIVCCPNYSIYPHGYMDDMVQDVVDCIAWVHANISKSGGDRGQIMLVGFSCGAHLCIMSILELFHRVPMEISARENDPLVAQQADLPAIRSLDDSGNLLNDNGASPTSSSSFDIINGTNSNNHRLETSNDATNILPSFECEINGDGGGDFVAVGYYIFENDGSDDAESVVTLTMNDEPASLRQLAMSIKAFVGISGLYDISSHYEYERARGVENVSSMSRAAYGHEYFDRLSPAFLLRSFSASERLPIVALIHGLDDIIIPYQATQRFVARLKQKFDSVSLHLIPGCDHPQACTHLMDRTLAHHEQIMEIIHDTHERSLTLK